MPQIMPVFGILAMVAQCLAISSNRRVALRRWPLIAWGLGLQAAFAFLILVLPVGQAFFSLANDVFLAILDCTLAGSRFVFGDQLADPSAGLGFFFAFNVLPVIIFVSALSAILYHLGVLQVVVKAISHVMTLTMKTSGAETLSASANIFVGQTEAPLMVRPFLDRMTDSELMTVMTGGFATIAGSVLAAYVGMLRDSVPDIAGHLLAASVMSAPAALMFGKLIIPETGRPETLGQTNIHLPRTTGNLVDAATQGTTEGVRLALNVGGMLIAFLALIALFNLGLKYVGGAVLWPVNGEFVPAESWTLERLMGYVFSPLAYLMGVPWGEATKAGELMGLKTVANEFVAYLRLQEMAPELSDRTRVIMTYALCGFANFGSVGIQIGGLAIMAPSRRAALARLALPAMFAGFLAANSTACIAAMLYREDASPPPPVVEQVEAKAAVIP